LRPVSVPASWSTFLRSTLAVVDPPFVLQASAAGQRAGRLPSRDLFALSMFLLVMTLLIGMGDECRSAR
jgi:hypothetical protein